MNLQYQCCCLLAYFLSISPLAAQLDSWDLPPLRYSASPAVNAMVELQTRWDQEKKPLNAVDDLDRLKAILALLEIPLSSQILVFSKTSKQNQLISPANPRALFFSKNAYAGFVPGGVMEVIIHDPLLGPVFYLINMGNAATAPQATRNTGDCLSCHASGRTEDVPGMLIRSVFPDQEGSPLLSLGTAVVDHATPIMKRWGGYYVTGSISLPHLGNRTYSLQVDAEPESSALPDLTKHIDASKYPQATSDIVALMILEHQCKAHNLLNAATIQYKRAAFLAKALDPGADPDLGSTGRIAENAAARIVDWLLFRDEASMGVEGVTGAVNFQEEFAASIPKARDGASLADFQLEHRIFKNRCSYMIYSHAFQSLPEPLRRRVLSLLERILSAEKPVAGYEFLKTTERRRILTILRDTQVL